MSEYIFSNNDAQRELRRLRLIEKVSDARSISLLESAGIDKGWRCLELGPGAGSLLRWMADRVGETGRVLGIDKNTAYIEHLKHPSIEIREGRIQYIELGEQFDLIHARYFFIHNKDSKALISRLLASLAPSGVLIAEEPDFSTAKWIDGDYSEAGNCVNRAICTMFDNAGLDPAYGSRVPLDMMMSGLEITHIDSRMHLCTGGTDMARMMAESTRILEAEYLSTGEVSRSDIQRYCEGALDSASLASYYTTVSVMGRVRRHEPGAICDMPHDSYKQ